MYVLLVIAFSLLQIPSSAVQPEQPIVKNGKSANKTDNGKQPSPVVTPVTTNGTPVSQPTTGSPDGEHQGEAEKRTYRVKVISNPFDWLYLIYVIVTGVAAGLAWRALIAIHNQTEALMDSQRSWFLVKHVKGPDMTGIWVERFTYVFQVIGNSPVRIIEAKFIFRLIEGRPSKHDPSTKEADLPDTPVYGKPDTLLLTPTMGMILAPGGEGPQVVVPLEDDFLTEEDREALKTWNKFACSYGFVRYKDAFSKAKTRETRFCFVYDVPQGLIPPDRTKENPNAFRIEGPPAYNEVT